MFKLLIVVLAFAVGCFGQEIAAKNNLNDLIEKTFAPTTESGLDASLLDELFTKDPSEDNAPKEVEASCSILFYCFEINDYNFIIEMWSNK